MPRFFVTRDAVSDNTVLLSGQDARHVTKSLRMQPGERLTVCDGAGTDYLCELREPGDVCTLQILSRTATAAEPKLSAALFMALPKGDKFELILQKCVELGVAEVYPMLTERCVSRPKDFEKKRVRYAAIAEAAAKQAGRGVIPTVHPLVTAADAADLMAQYERAAVLYEAAPRGGVKELIEGHPSSVAFAVGAEGGFSAEEVAVFQAAGAQVVGLGPRILRCETAPICFLSVLMHEAGDLD